MSGSDCRRLAEDPDNEYAMIDSTIVLPTSTALVQKGTPSAGSHRTQQGWPDHENPRHLCALGNPTGFHLTPGQVHDLEGADVLLPGREERAGYFSGDLWGRLRGRSVEARPSRAAIFACQSAVPKGCCRLTQVRRVVRPGCDSGWSSEIGFSVGSGVRGGIGECREMQMRPAPVPRMLH